jgi:SAM-dependent methyltransferase
MNPSSTSHYSFGDNDLAALRLERLAAAYGPSSAAFMREALSSDGGRSNACADANAMACAIDLGSGLGFTTKLLGEVSGARLVVGYERSAKYLAQASSRHPTLAFREVDVLAPPYPDREIDAIYSRFLLTHLHRPEAVIATCLDHLRPGGRLLLEETSDLASPLPTLQKYYAMVGEMQAHYGQELYIGLRLADIARASGSGRVIAKQTSVILSAATMAELHAMNIATWKRDPYMLATHGLDALERLEAALNGVAQNDSPQPPVTSVMAQVVVERC